MSESVSYEIVVDSGGSTPESKTTEALAISAKQGLLRAVLGGVPGTGARVAPWVQDLPAEITSAVEAMPVDGILDQTFVRTLAAASQTMAESQRLSAGARANLRSLAVSATASADAGIANPDLLRGLVWLSLAGESEAARNEEAGDFIVLRGVIAPPIRSMPVAYAQRNPVKTGIAAALAVSGILYLGSKALR